MREIPFGGMLFVGSLGRNKETGFLVLIGVLTGQASGKRLGRNGLQYFFMLFSLWGMVKDCAFGRMLGVVRRPFVTLSLLCLHWLPTKCLWWLISGTFLGRRGDGLLALLDLSMIGSWRRYFAFSIPVKGR